MIHGQEIDPLFDHGVTAGIRDLTGNHPAAKQLKVDSLDIFAFGNYDGLGSGIVRFRDHKCRSHRRDCITSTRHIGDSIGAVLIGGGLEGWIKLRGLARTQTDHDSRRSLSFDSYLARDSRIGIFLSRRGLRISALAESGAAK